MTYLLKGIPILALLCIAAVAGAQNTGVANNDNGAVVDNSAKLAELEQYIEQGVRENQALNSQLDLVAQADREAAEYRADKRSLKLLQALDQLTLMTSALPAEDPRRIELEGRLREDLVQVAHVVLDRIGHLNSRIEDLGTTARSLSGGSLIATEANIHSLEKLRMEYYDSLVHLVEGRKALNMPVDRMMDALQNLLSLHAETLAGRVQYSGAALDDLRARLAASPGDANLTAVAQDMSASHQLNLKQLEAISSLLARLGLDNAGYKSLLLQQGKGFSVKDLEKGVLGDLIRDGWQRLRETLSDNAPDIVFRLLVFLLIVLVFRSLSRLVRRLVMAACERSGADMSTLLKDVLASVSGGAVMFIGLLMALSQIGISLGPMLAGLGVAGFIVGFALQDTLANFAAGGMILIYRPYDVDDFVEVTGASGLVKKMSLVSTTITTFDNQTLVVPNSKIWGDVIKNVTAQKIRRVDLAFGIGYRDDIEHAERVLADIVSRHELVLSKPEATIKVHTLGDSSVNFIVRPWARTEDYWTVYWDITREVKLRFDREGISIPFPQRDVHIYNEFAESKGRV